MDAVKSPGRPRSQELLGSTQSEGPLIPLKCSPDKAHPSSLPGAQDQIKTGPKGVPRGLFE